MSSIILDILEPEYNILKIARSRLGSLHSALTKAKISEIKTGKTHSAESKVKISKIRWGKYSGDNNPNFGKTHSPETRAKMSGGIPIFIYDLKGSLINTFPSGRKTAEFLNSFGRTVYNYFKSGKIFQGKWLLSTSAK